MKSLEAIARNNLKMAGKDEVLVIINKPQPQPEVQDKKKKTPKKEKRTNSVLKPRNER